VSPYTYNTSNELMSLPNGSYTYDNNGNTKTKPDGTQYFWDFENRLTQVVLPTGGTVNFKYDPLGRRIQKSFTQSGTTTTTDYLYDGPNRLEDVDVNGNLLARYVQGKGIDEPLEEIASGTTSYYQQDGLGSVTSLSSTTGTIGNNTYTYDSYGNTTTSATVVNPYRYTGREFDTETGLYYYRARYYDQSVGRFLSEDPSGLGGGINFYSYTGDSPANRKDALGLDYTTYQSVIAPVVYVNASITIYGPGANDALASQWQQYITNAWNKNPGFGKCKVHFNVQVVADPSATHWWNASSYSDFAGANNFIYVPEGMPDNPSIDIGQFTGTIPASTLSFSVAGDSYFHGGILVTLWPKVAQ
jgi:RHS repeat-associated protein